MEEMNAINAITPLVENKDLNLRLRLLALDLANALILGPTACSPTTEEDLQEWMDTDCSLTTEDQPRKGQGRAKEGSSLNESDSLDPEARCNACGSRNRLCRCRGKI